MSGPVQRDEVWLKQADPADVVGALESGELADLVSRRPPAPVPASAPEGQVSEAELKAMGPDAISEAFEAGRLDFLLGRPVKTL